MNKIISALVLAVMVFSTVGCGSSAKSKEAAPVENRAVGGETDITNNAVADAALPAEASIEIAVDESADKKAYRLVSDLRVSEELELAVSDAIFEKNSNIYLKGECSAEGHLIMDVIEDKTITTVYALTTYGEYGFMDDMFIKISGSGVIPVSMTFSINKDDGSYVLESYTEPADGSGYTESIKGMFPNELQNRVLSISYSDRMELQQIERAYARAFLEKMGRTAQIGEYSDLEMEFPDIPNDVSNEIFERYWEYPSWVGTQEKVEDGVRYVYETQWKNYGNNDALVYFTKYVLETGEIVKTVNVHIDNGEITSSEEVVLRIVENSSK